MSAYESSVLTLPADPVVRQRLTDKLRRWDRQYLVWCIFNPRPVASLERTTRYGIHLVEELLDRGIVDTDSILAELKGLYGSDDFSEQDFRDACWDVRRCLTSGRLESSANFGSPNS